MIICSILSFSLNSYSQLQIVRIIAYDGDHNGDIGTVEIEFNKAVADTSFDGNVISDWQFSTDNFVTWDYMNTFDTNVDSIGLGTGTNDQFIQYYTPHFSNLKGTGTLKYRYINDGGPADAAYAWNAGVGDTLQNTGISLAEDWGTPQFISAYATTDSTIELKFSEKVLAFFSNPANWTASGITAVGAYTKSSDSTIIVLKINSLGYTGYSASNLALNISGANDSIWDLAGNRAVSFSGKSVTDSIPPAFYVSSGVDIDGSGSYNLTKTDQLTFTFSEILNSSSRTSIGSYIINSHNFGEVGDLASVIWNNDSVITVTVGGNPTINLGASFGLNSSDVYDNHDNHPASIALILPSVLTDITPPTGEVDTALWKTNIYPKNEYLNTNDEFNLVFSEPMQNGSSETTNQIIAQIIADLSITAPNFTVTTTDDSVFTVKYTGSTPYQLWGTKHVDFAAGSLHDTNGLANTSIIRFEVKDIDNVRPVFKSFFVDHINGTDTYIAIVFTEPIWFNGLDDDTEIDVYYDGTNKNVSGTYLDNYNTRAEANDTVIIRVTGAPTSGQTIHLYVYNPGYDQIVDLAQYPNSLAGTLHETITYDDSEPPTNQNTVFPNSMIVKGLSAVNITSSGDVNNEVWFAIHDPVDLAWADTMTSTAGNSTVIIAPKNEGIYHLYVVDLSGNISDASIAVLIVDNTPPVIDSVVISNSPMLAGDNLPVSIYVETDTTELKNLNGTIGGFALNNLSKLADNLYSANFTITTGATDIIASNNIPVSVSLSDSAGNTSIVFSTPISQNADPIYANYPTAIIAGNDRICQGDSATLSVRLTGYSPWNVSIYDGTSNLLLSNITYTPYYFKVGQATDGTFKYTVSNVTDITTLAQPGVDTATLIVDTLPIVTILNPPDLKTYSSSAVADTLIGNPLNGIFSGPGVLPFNNTFHPSEVANGTHEIIYTFTDGHNCSSGDTVEVTVRDSVAQIEIPPGNIINCKEDPAFTITGNNDYGVDGLFYIMIGGIKYDSGMGLENTGSNTATIYPGQIANGEYEIYYSHDPPSEFSVKENITIIDVSTPIITGVNDRCINGDTINLIASNLIPANGYGHFSYDGPPSGFVINDPNGNKAIMQPYLMGVGTYTVEYYYESLEGCYSDTLDNIINIHALPEVSFTSKKLYNIEESASTLIGTPSGGTFTGGAYISGNSFNPAVAGIGTHPIMYYYTDPFTTCSNDSARTVKVEKASGSINGINPSRLYCYGTEIDTFTALPANGNGSPGSFTLFDGLTSADTNKAAFNPAIAGGNPSGGTKEHIIRFNYIGWDSVTAFVLRDTIEVDYIPTVNFSGLDDSYCVNDNIGHDLIGNSPTAGTGQFLPFPGLFVNGDRAKLYPFQVDSFPAHITYQFQSPTGCKRDTSISFSLNPLPVLAFNLRPAFSWQEDPITLSGEPTGGKFTGDGGVLSIGDTIFTFDPGFFDGPIFNVKITYDYTDSNSCRNTLTDTVDILDPSATITALRSTNKQYCIYDEVDTIVGKPNVQDLPGGYFDTITDILVNISEDTALFYPQNAKRRDYDVTYRYVDVNGAQFDVTTTLYVDTVRKPTFLNIFNGDEFCQNDNALDIITNGDASLTTSYTLDNVPLTVGIFNPANGVIGSNSLKCTFTQLSTGCIRSDSIHVLIRAVPIINFTVSDNCVNEEFPDSISFINNTTLASSDSILLWIWNFDDVNSGAANIDSLRKNPRHLYKESGNRLINLETWTDKGCNASLSKKLEFGDKPKADFSWNNECFTTFSDVTFTDKSASISPIDNYEWRFYDNDSTSTNQNPVHRFYIQDNHIVELQVFTQKGCSDTIQKIIRMRPTVSLVNNPYFEDFETGENGWYPENDEENSLYSWNFGIPSGKNIKPPASGYNVWYTKIEDISQVEQSWITSPCFDFTGMQRPMIKLNIARDLETDRNGIVIQSTTNNGQTWTNVGRPDEGINWYNSFEINKGPGGQSSGWTGSAPAWTEARQHLEGLETKNNVRFRIAFSNDGNGLKAIDGFALDNIWIGERTKNVLLEHFTNESSSNSLTASENIDALLNATNDIIPIYYHTSFPGTDVLNQFYPAGPSARALYYGITEAPYAIINGGYASSLIFNQDITSFDKNDIIVWSLYDPLFNISIQSNKSGNAYTINTAIEALEDIEKKEIALRVAIIEKTVNSGSLEYSNVLRKMLPNAGGTIINSSWSSNDTRTDAFSWTVPAEIDIDNIAAIVFLQDEFTGEVYQVATDDSTFLQTGIFEPKATNASLQYMLYPNPAKESVHILFTNILEQECRLDLINSTGQLISSNNILPGTKLHEVTLENLRSGIYFIRISTNKGIVSTKKLLILPD